MMNSSIISDQQVSEEHVNPDKREDNLHYCGSIWSDPKGEISHNLVRSVRRLESHLGIPVWLLVQPHAHHMFSQLDTSVRKGFFRSRHELDDSGPIALVVDSPGGNAGSAYDIARLLQRHCGGFIAVVPRIAKSAATLLTLGANRIIMGRDAELGPLDAQLLDMDREDWSSALDEVQTLDRINAASLEQFDQTMMVLAIRTQKKFDTLIPWALRYTADMTRPLLESIDTVHYIKQLRILKVGEDYACRLLEPKYGSHKAQEIAARLVNDYPEHGFIIDREEAAELLSLEILDSELESIIDQLGEALLDNTVTILGTITTRDSGSTDGPE